MKWTQQVLSLKALSSVHVAIFLSGICMYSYSFQEISFQGTIYFMTNVTKLSTKQAQEELKKILKAYSYWDTKDIKSSSSCKFATKFVQVE